MLIRFDVYHHFGDNNVAELERLLKLLLKQGEVIMANTEEVVQTLNNANTKLDKVASEIGGLQTEIADLKTAVENAKNPDPAIVEAATRLEQRAQSLDDLNVDPEPPPA